MTAIEKLGEAEGKDAWVLTLQAPSLMPALQYLEDNELRREIWGASDELGSTAPFANQKLVSKILSLRQEKAELLGKADFSEVALSRRMAKSGKNAEDFIYDLHQKTLPFFTKENKELETFKAEKTGSNISLLEPWEVGYWAEKLKKERYDFDDEDLRPYFPIQSVLDGMFNLVTKIFGLKITERPTLFEGKNCQQIHSSEKPVEVWHPDVYFMIFSIQQLIGYLVHSMQTGTHELANGRVHG